MPSITDISFVEQCQPSGDGFGALQIVRDHDGCHGMFLLQLENQLINLAGGNRIESRRGFIQQQDVGVESQRPRQPHSLLHAAGNIGRHLLKIAFHPHTLQQFLELDSAARTPACWCCASVERPHFPPP